MNFFSIVNKKTGETITPAYITEEGKILEPDFSRAGPECCGSEAGFRLRTDQDDLEIRLFNGVVLPVAIIEPVIAIQEQVNKIKEGFGLNDE